jgi:hypothetical protein
MDHHVLHRVINIKIILLLHLDGISSEKFMQKFSYLDNLKLRAGIGQTSNQSISPYASLGLVSPYNYNIFICFSPGGTIRYNYGPSTIVTGYNLVTLPNPNLDWEYTKTINVGLDFSFLKVPYFRFHRMV